MSRPLRGPVVEVCSVKAPVSKPTGGFGKESVCVAGLPFMCPYGPDPKCWIHDVLQLGPAMAPFMCVQLLLILRIVVCGWVASCGQGCTDVAAMHGG
jgi:hypothetical protein